MISVMGMVFIVIVMVLNMMGSGVKIYSMDMVRKSG